MDVQSLSAAFHHSSLRWTSFSPSFDPKLRFCKNVPFIPIFDPPEAGRWHRGCPPPRAINSSSSDSGLNLKARPKLKPVRPPASEPETEASDAHVERPPPASALCGQIERLVLFKRYGEALEIFDFLRSKGGRQALGATTYDMLVNACVGLRSIRDTKEVFNHMIETEFVFDQYMRNRVLLMHVKCGMMLDARFLFQEMPDRNLVSWNTIISGLVESGSYGDAFEMFLSMWQEFSDGGTRTFAAVIRAAAGLGEASRGRQLHACVLKLGMYGDVFVSCALIDMYSKCGSIEESQWVFDEMPEKSVVGWNTIIAGYALNGYSEEALDLYCEMQESGVRMDHFTYSIIFRICARLASLEHAKQAHAGLVRNGFGSDLVANTALVDLYCKWGRMEEARNVFDKMPRKNIISWNALIGGYANHGRGGDAIIMFERMVKEGMIPNHVTFLAVLSACSYSGLSEKGWELFESMSENYNVKPRAMHYACMIELLGREGLMDEALSLIKEAPFNPTPNMWGALLTACRVHKNLELGMLAVEKLFRMEPEKISNYIVLLNICTNSGKLDEAAKVLEVLRKRGLRLRPSCSWIEIKKESHVFHFGDRSHPQTKEIYNKVDELMKKVEKLGYISDGKSVFPDVGEHEERQTSYHSEKLAIAFGLITTSVLTPLQVVQSHRICGDCHKVIKLIALVTGRDIVIRDSSRFHHFNQGSCSCGDYW